jgi:signal transduction histidine kinase
MVPDDPMFALALTVLAVGVGALLATRWLAVGAGFAAAASFVASVEIRRRGGLDTDVLFGSGIWLGLVELLVLGGLAFWCTRRLPTDQLVIVLGPIIAAVAVMGEWRPTFVGYRFVSIALLIGLGGCIAAGALLRQSDQQRSTAADRARQDERLAIARELHDVVAHHVTGIVVQAQAGQLIAEDDPVRAAGTLSAIEQAGAEALASMRRMVGALREPDDATAPTAPAASLGELTELAEHSADLGLPVRLHVDVVAVPADVAQSVHRIAREALTNARRHASGATEVDVHVVQGASELSVAIVDDGHPRPFAGGGFGIVGMAERVHALGGTFRAGPRPSPAHGWEVRASFPITVEAPG